MLGIDKLAMSRALRPPENRHGGAAGGGILGALLGGTMGGALGTATHPFAVDMVRQQLGPQSMALQTMPQSALDVLKPAMGNVNHTTATSLRNLLRSTPRSFALPLAGAGALAVGGAGLMGGGLIDFFRNRARRGAWDKSLLGRLSRLLGTNY